MATISSIANTPAIPGIAVRPLLTAEDLAKLFSCSVSSIYGRRSRGEPLPPAIKFGNAVRWRQEAVDAWLTEQGEA
ncbi:helix-turn-helix transcriptional regulator [Nesterenkonia sp. CF4.4]|uniref:helix-turn-helix transcriptional regulator n=1 Tax=Nesterenkonia sp. CF4.4 TaxID=3373079 RepID=UPI003EE796F8